MEEFRYELPRGFSSRRVKQALELLATLEGVSAELLNASMRLEHGEAEALIEWMEKCGFVTHNEGKRQYRVTLTKEAYLAFCDRYYPFADGEDEEPAFRLLHLAPRPCSPSSPAEEAQGEDPVLELGAESCRQALDCVRGEGAVSISLLQRKMSVGYPRAGRLVEWMEREGYISPFDGARPRRVLLTQEQYDSFIKKYFGN